MSLHGTSLSRRGTMAMTAATASPGGRTLGMHPARRAI
jgi:hypothetical protein